MMGQALMQPSRTAALAAVLTLLPAAAHAADWIVDTVASRIGFSGTQLEAPFTGRFKTFKATIDFDPNHPETGHALVLVDLASAETGDAQRDEALPQADWFDVKTKQEARFEATRFLATGKDSFDAMGSLTIRSIRHDLTLPFHLAIVDGKAHAVGHLQLIRTDFGIGQGEWSTGQWIALAVGVDIDLVARQ